jgi:hypothetical protein
MFGQARNGFIYYQVFAGWRTTQLNPSLHAPDHVRVPDPAADPAPAAGPGPGPGTDRSPERDPGAEEAAEGAVPGAPTGSNAARAVLCSRTRSREGYRISSKRSKIFWWNSSPTTNRKLIRNYR